MTYRPRCRCRRYHEPSCAFHHANVDPAGLAEERVDTEASFARAAKLYPAAVMPTFLEPASLPFEPDDPADPDRSWAHRDSGE